MSGYDTQKIIKTFNISELSIPNIVNNNNVYISTIEETKTFILEDLYDYPYSNELIFNITTTSHYSYDNRILTFTPDFRNTNYILNIEAYDPYFTNQTFQNSSNNIINYNITEKPPLEFNSITSTTFIYNVNNDGSSKYVFEESYDRSGLINGEEQNPTITVYIDDKIKFIRTTA